MAVDQQSALLIDRQIKWPGSLGHALVDKPFAGGVGQGPEDCRVVDRLELAELAHGRSTAFGLQRIDLGTDPSHGLSGSCSEPGRGPGMTEEWVPGGPHLAGLQR